MTRHGSIGMIPKQSGNLQYGCLQVKIIHWRCAVIAASGRIWLLLFSWGSSSSHNSSLGTSHSECRLVHQPLSSPSLRSLMFARPKTGIRGMLPLLENALAHILQPRHLLPERKFNPIGIASPYGPDLAHMTFSSSPNCWRKDL